MVIRVHDSCQGYDPRGTCLTGHQRLTIANFTLIDPNMAASNKELIKKARAHCEQVMNEELKPQVFQYHNFSHVLEMKEVALSLAEHYKLSGDEMANIEIACLFHDIGYKDGAEGHEHRAVDRLNEFFSSEDVSKDRLERIGQLIMATRMNGTADDLSMRIMKDADCHHVGTKQFFAKSGMLRAENEMLSGESISERDWLTENLQFLHSHKFHTPVAEANYNDRKRKNILKVQKQLKGLLEYENTVVEIDHEQADLAMDLPANKADRGIETMFRVTLRNHNNLSVIADNKANIMLSINSIMLSIVLSSLAPKLDTNPALMIPTIVLTVVCVVSVVIAVLATRPKISNAKYSDEAFMNKKFNMLFFGNFFRLPIDKFEWGIKTLMNNEDMLYSSLSKDLYFLGVVLARKYRLLWICYNVFAVGIILSAVSFIWAFSVIETVDTDGLLD